MRKHYGKFDITPTNHKERWALRVRSEQFHVHKEGNITTYDPPFYKPMNHLLNLHAIMHMVRRERFSNEPFIVTLIITDDWYIIEPGNYLGTEGDPVMKGVWGQVPSELDYIVGMYEMNRQYRRVSEIYRKLYPPIERARMLRNNVTFVLKNEKGDVLREIKYSRFWK